jgi:hypothetical protein
MILKKNVFFLNLSRFTQNSSWWEMVAVPVPVQLIWTVGEVGGGCVGEGAEFLLLAGNGRGRGRHGGQAVRQGGEFFPAHPVDGLPASECELSR